MMSPASLPYLYALALDQPRRGTGSGLNSCACATAIMTLSVANDQCELSTCANSFVSANRPVSVHRCTACTQGSVTCSLALLFMLWATWLFTRRVHDLPVD